MFFGGSDEDDGSGFTIGKPSSGSNLSSLFGKQAPSAGNESLKYTAPKQPKQKEEELKKNGNDSKADAPPALLHACACHTYKLIDGKYASQGKLGAALLGNHAANNYKILLYVSQKKPVTTAVINSKFLFNVQQNNYATFYDDQQQNWSLCFDSESNLLEYAKWIGLARFNTSRILTLQNLNELTGQEICKGDTVEMQYTGWLHTANTFGKIFDSNKDTGKLFKFKVGKGKVIKGWDTGIIGMKKNSKRLLVIPPDHAYGSKNVGDRVPPNSTLIFQVEVTRVKYVNPVEDDTMSIKSLNITPSASNITPSASLSNMDSETNDNPQPASADPSTVDETNPELQRSGSLKERTKSISEQLSKTPENSKSKLLERMSKMGQSVMMSPANQLQKSTSEEAELSEEIQTTQPVTIETRKSTSSEHGSFKSESPKPMLRPKPEAIHRPMAAPPHNVHEQPMYQAAPHPSMAGYPQSAMHHQLSLYQSQPPNLYGMGAFQQPMPQTGGGAVFAQPNMSSTEMNLMMTDGRLKHTEIKTDLTRLLEKVDTLSNQVNKLENNQQNQLMPSHQQQLMMSSNPAVEMEAVVIMQNVSRIIKENEKLRVDCEEKTKKIELLNDRMTDLLTKNQHFFEKSNQLLANQSDSIQSNATEAMVKVATLEQQKISLQSEVSSSQKELLLFKKKEEDNMKNETDMQIKIEKLQKEMKQMKESADLAGSSSTEHENAIEGLTKKLKSEKKELKQMKMKVEELDEVASELQVEKESLTKTITELKKKRKEDLKKNEEEIEETKTQHEDELRKLHQRYKKNGNSENDKLLQLEDELKIKYEEKLKKKIEELNKQHQNRVDELNTEKDLLETNLNKQILDIRSAKKEEIESITNENLKLKENNEEITKKLEEQTTVGNQSSTSHDELNHLTNENIKLKETIQQLNNEIKEIQNINGSNIENNTDLIDELRKLQDEKLQSDRELQETSEKIKSLSLVVAEKENLYEKLQEARDDAFDQGVEEGRATMKTISNASYERGLKEGKASAAAPDKSVVTEEVKKVMNTVFFQLKNKFNAAEEYSGKDVILAILNTIKDVTLKMVQAEDGEQDSDSEEESDEEEDTDDDEESVEVDGPVKVNAAQEEVSDPVITKEADKTDKIKTTDEIEPKLPPSIERLRSHSDSDESFKTDEGDVDDDDKSNVDEGNDVENNNANSDDVNINDVENNDVSSNDVNTRDVNSNNATYESDQNIVQNEQEIESVRKNTLESVGLDSSLFETDDNVATNHSTEEESLVKTEGKVDPPTAKEVSESDIFFASNVEEGKEKKVDSTDDDEDEDDFFKAKTKTASAFDRSPPPLFGDDDDDTNWI